MFETPDKLVVVKCGANSSGYMPPLIMRMQALIILVDVDVCRCRICAQGWTFYRRSRETRVLALVNFVWYGICEGYAYTHTTYTHTHNTEDASLPRHGYGYA
jgi:hypothetical protein